MAKDTMYSRIVLLSLAVLGLTVTAARPQGQPTKKWPRATPSDVGLDPKKLAAFEAEILKGNFTYVDTVTVIRHGMSVAVSDFTIFAVRIAVGRDWLIAA